jgi:transcriptional regulator with XRE-family HTH domain
MALGMHQVDCAAQAGISRPYLSQLETGARRDMTPPTYTALRTALQLKATDHRLLATPEDSPRKERHGHPH